MASIIKKEEKLSKAGARENASCRFVDELLNSEPDSKTTILNADTKTIILNADVEIEEESNQTEIETSAETEVEAEPQVEKVTSLEEPPGTTVLNFADVTSKELKEKEKPEVKAEVKSEPKKEETQGGNSVLKKAKAVVSKKGKETPTPDETPSIWVPETKPQKKETAFQVKVKKSDEVFDLQKEKTTVGKSKYSDIQIKDTQTVSRTHIILHLEDDKLIVEDNKSLNGTFVNNERLVTGERREVSDGDVIRVSDEELIVCSKEGGR